MDMYFVHLEACPTVGSQEFGQVGGANVDIYVQAGGLVEATQKAIAYLNARLWVVTAELAALKMTPERIASMDAIGKSLFHRAESEGLFSFSIAWPVKDRDVDLAELRPLRDEDKSSPTQH